MMDSAVVTSDFDRLAERVEKAATLVEDLRGRLAQAQARVAELEAALGAASTDKAETARRAEEALAPLQGQDPAALVGELAALRKEQREWLAERKDVAGRVESLLKKLERIEA